MSMSGAFEAEDEGNRGAASGPAERRARQRQAEQGVRQVVQSTLI